MSVDVVTFGCRLNVYESEVIRREAGAVRAADSVLPLPQPILDGKVQVRQVHEGEVAAGDSICHRVRLHRRTA